MKLYIKTQNTNPQVFDDFIVKEITPLVQLNNYWDYGNWYKLPASANIFFDGNLSAAQRKANAFISRADTIPFLVFISYY